LRGQFGGKSAVDFIRTMNRVIYHPVFSGGIIPSFLSPPSSSFPSNGKEEEA
jgi:hypothetical protein